MTVGPGQVPWDSPSRFGRPGLLARRALQRVLRPYTTRLDQRLERIEALVGGLDIRIVALESRLTEGAERVAETESLAWATLESRLPAAGRAWLHRSDSTPSRVICSLGTGPDRAMLGLSSLSHEAYGRRWGWDVVASTEDLAAGRPTSWGKIRLVQSLLDEYAWVLLLDADVVVTDLGADIMAEVEPDKDLYLVEHDWGEFTANMGVFLLRSSAWARKFLDEVWAMEQYVDHPWWENAAALELLGYGLDPARLVSPTARMSRTKLVDRRWNGIELDRPDRPAFVHRGFHEPRHRSRHLAGDLQCVLAGADPMLACDVTPPRVIERPADVRRREELPALLNRLELVGAGAEIGVRKGEYSEWLLRFWTGKSLLSVDPWLADEPDAYRDISTVSQPEHERFLGETVARLARFGDRSRIARMTSAEAAGLVAPESLDFVYLDARHDEASVEEDLGLWWPRVRPGGICAGHDYLDGDNPGGHYGVKTAVDGFFSGTGIEVVATTEDEPWPSWIVRKPGRRTTAAAPILAARTSAMVPSASP